MLILNPTVPVFQAKEGWRASCILVVSVAAVACCRGWASVQRLRDRPGSNRIACCRGRTSMQRLRDRPGRREAAADVHQPQHPHLLPAQRHLGHRQPMSEQGPAAAHGHDPGDPAGALCTYSPRRHQRKFSQALSILRPREAAAWSGFFGPRGSSAQHCAKNGHLPCLLVHAAAALRMNTQTDNSGFHLHTRRYVTSGAALRCLCERGVSHAIVLVVAVVEATPPPFQSRDP